MPVIIGPRFVLSQGDERINEGDAKRDSNGIQESSERFTIASGPTIVPMERHL